MNVINQHRVAPTAMRRLIEEFEAESESNVGFQDTVASLRRYGEVVDTGPPIGLEEKLRAAGRERDFARAVRLKEAFHKKLTKYRLSKAAQEIFGFVLAKLEMAFQLQIEPMVDAEVDQVVLQRLLLEVVIQPIEEVLEDNPLLVDAAEIMGMLYYLTGNCHIRWHRM